MLKKISNKLSRLSSLQICHFSGNKFFTDQEIKKSRKYVEQTMRSRTWINYMLASYYPKQIKPYFYAIHLFDMQLNKISENAREEALGLGKLDFWKNVIFKIYNNQKPAAQPISICLYQAIHNNPLTQGYFLRMINVRAEQIMKRQLEDMGQMRRMADFSKGTILALQLELLRIEIDNDHIREVISYLGQAIGICQYLRRVPFALKHNKFLLPEDILNKYNLTTLNIWDRVYGKPTEELYDAVLQIASYAKKAFQKAVQVYETNQKQINPHAYRALLKGIQIELYLINLEKYNFNLFDVNVNKHNPFKLPYYTYQASKKKRFCADLLPKSKHSH